MVKTLGLAMGLLLSHYAVAGFVIPGIVSPQFQQEHNALAKAGLTEFHDEVLDERIEPLNERQLHEAKVWELTQDEEQRYLNLMRSKSSIYYQGLRMTPVDILGLNARDDAERAHFATRAAQQEAQKVAQNIAWNNAFNQAYNQLFKGIPVVGNFDPAPYSPYAHQPIQLHENDALYLFIKPHDAVTTIVLQLIDALNRTPNTQLHLLFLDMDSEAIQLWANRHQLPIHLVAGQTLTLNPGQLQYESLQLESKETPLLLLAKGKKSHVVDLGRF